MTVTQWECEPALAQTWPSSLVCLHSGCLLGTPQRTLCPPQPHSPSRPAAFPAPPDVQGQVEVALGLHGFAGLGQPLGPSPNRPAPHPHLDPNLWGPQPRWAPHTPHGVRPLPQPPGTPLSPPTLPSCPSCPSVSRSSLQGSAGPQTHAVRTRVPTSGSRPVLSRSHSAVRLPGTHPCPTPGDGARSVGLWTRRAGPSLGTRRGHVLP